MDIEKLKRLLAAMSSESSSYTHNYPSVASFSTEVQYLESHEKCFECDLALSLLTVYPDGKGITMDNIECHQLTGCCRDCWDSGYSDLAVDPQDQNL